MKKYLFILAATAALTSCYDDYVKDNDTQAVGFANQTDVRSVIVGEGMKFSTGVALGGTIENSVDRPISFEIDYSLVSDATLQAMKTHVFSYIQNLTRPLGSLEALSAEEYKLLPEGGTDGRVTIRRGSHLGQIVIKIDSAKFLADASRTLPTFVIPLRLTDGNGTDLIAGKETSVIGVRYENMLFGNYWHGGETVVTDASGAEVNRIAYYTTVPQSETRVWTLTTVLADVQRRGRRAERFEGPAQADAGRGRGDYGERRGRCRLCGRGRRRVLVQPCEAVAEPPDLSQIQVREGWVDLSRHRYADVPQPRARRRERVAGRESR